jgi:ribonuclease HI
MCNDLLDDGVEVEIIWIPSHVGLEGNEIVDKRARHAVLNSVVFDRPLSRWIFRVWQDLFC